MASARSDDLARRLAERLDRSPTKGSAMKATGEDVATAPVSPPAPTESRVRTPPGPKRSARTVKGASSERAPSNSRRQDQSERTDVERRRSTRRSTGTTLRGHLVPDAVHRDARRRKVELRSRRGERVTWDDVMSEAVAHLVDHPARATDMLDDLDATRGAVGRRRLVQATLPEDLDRRLVEIHLDLIERSDRIVTYEQLWTTCIRLWLDATS